MNDQSKKEDGLPETAQDNNHKKPIVMILIGIVIAVSFTCYFFKRPDKKAEVMQDETYTLPVDISVQHKKGQPEIKAQPVSQAQSSPPVSQEMIQQQMVLLQEKQKELQQRLAAPLMMVNHTQAESAAAVVSETSSKSKDANTQFMRQISSDNTASVTATTIGALNAVIAEGTLIHATLESASNSDLPGYLRASISEPVYSEDATQVLIPRGSRLIGQYKSGMLQGQSRIFIVWTRLITPQGLSLQLGSPGVDSLGVAGMGADEINRHFWERFGMASLLSMIGTGAANVGVHPEDQQNSASAYRSAVANSFAQSANQSLQQEGMIAPTLKSYQGKPIMVFVAKDLHFANAAQLIKPKMYIF